MGYGQDLFKTYFFKKNDTQSTLLGDFVFSLHTTRQRMTEDVSRIDRESGSAEAEPRHSIENKTLVVTTIKSPPYAMFKQSPER